MQRASASKSAVYASTCGSVCELGLLDGLLARRLVDFCFGWLVRVLGHRGGGAKTKRQACDGRDDVACHMYPDKALSLV